MNKSIFSRTYRVVKKWGHAISEILQIYNFAKSSLFTSIMIETYGHCNRRCDFCFNSPRFPKREVGIMDENIWKKIIDELGSLNYTGRISPHFYGEPLLDQRLPAFIAYARQRCPHAFIKMSTNGDRVNEPTLKNLLGQGLDKLVVTNYDECEHSELVALAAQYPKHVQYRSYRDFGLVDRAGKLFELSEKQSLKVPCLRPSRQIVINWKGNVLLCCNDYYETYCFGNVKEASLVKLWNKIRFKRLRLILSQKGGRKRVAFCKYCDCI